MKNLLFAMFLLTFAAFSVDAQISTPAPSPSSTIIQDVGLTEVTIKYSRPGKKGRTLYGVDGLVPDGKLWRTGANAATKMTVDKDVTVNGQALAKGSYAILTKPSATTWTINLYPYEKSSWSSYVEKTPAVSMVVDTKKNSRSVESFTINIGNLTSKSADVALLWGNKVIPFQIGADADGEVMAAIEKTLAGPSAGDYYTAGSYYFSSGKDLKKALEYVSKATEGDNPRFWQVKKKAEILAKLGKYKDAIKVAETALALAEKAGNADYVKMNKDNIASWAKM